MCTQGKRSAWPEEAKTTRRPVEGQRSWSAFVVAVRAGRGCAHTVAVAHECTSTSSRTVANYRERDHDGLAVCRVAFRGRALPHECTMHVVCAAGFDHHRRLFVAVRHASPWSGEPTDLLKSTAARRRES